LKKFRLNSLRSQIIITFGVLTSLLIIILSQISYHFVKNIYLQQLTDHVSLIGAAIGESLPDRYLQYLSSADNSSLAQAYFRDQLKEYARKFSLPEAFVFNRKLEILADSRNTTLLPYPEPQLLIYKIDIQSMQPRQTKASMPFQGKDGNWYMWGFYRINEEQWLGIREDARRLAKIDQFSRLFWIIGAGGIVLTILAGGLLSHAITRPIDKLVRFSKQLGEGDFQVPIPKDIRGELSILVNALDQMRRNLARTQQEKEQMLAQIAHEIRNPLGGIELLTGLVKEDLEKNNADTQYIHKVQEEIAKLKLLITAYLNYSRPPEPKPQWVKIAGVISDIHQSLVHQLNEKKIRLQIENQVSEIWFDPDHLRQILFNLISNSIQATDPEGNITVKIDKNERSWFIEVSDNGAGIPAEIHDKIFEPFFTTRSDGIGLGLSICQKLCRENGAEIRLASRADRGCMFIISKATNSTEIKT